MRLLHSVEEIKSQKSSGVDNSQAPMTGHVPNIVLKEKGILSIVWRPRYFALDSLELS